MSRGEGRNQQDRQQKTDSDEFEGSRHVNDCGDLYGCVESQGRGALHCNILFWK